MGRHIHKLCGNRPDTDNWFPTPKDIVDKMVANYGYALNGKSVHCFADDYQTSYFYLILKAKFKELGLTKLYATKYVENGKGIQACYDGMNEVVKLLDDDGSLFNECSKDTTKDCDVIFTNPPFKGLHKMCREVLHDKQYVIITPYACLPCQIVAGIADGKLYIEPDTIVIWNYDHTKPARCDIISSFKPLNYKTLEPRTFTALYDPEKHLKFKNIKEPYDILPNIVNCDRMKDFPVDYDGAVAVPQPFINFAANCPQQFEILGTYEKVAFSDWTLNNERFLCISCGIYNLTNGRIPFVRLIVRLKGIEHDKQTTH